MKRLGMLEEQQKPSTANQQVYDRIFVDDLNPSHAEAMKELFPVAGQVERPRLQRTVDQVHG